jgi:hypothetical protein
MPYCSSGPQQLTVHSALSLAFANTLAPACMCGQRHISSSVCHLSNLTSTHARYLKQARGPVCTYHTDRVVCSSATKPPRTSGAGCATAPTHYSMKTTCAWSHTHLIGDQESLPCYTTYSPLPLHHAHLYMQRLVLRKNRMLAFKVSAKCAR